MTWRGRVQLIRLCPISSQFRQPGCADPASRVGRVRFLYGRSSITYSAGGSTATPVVGIGRARKPLLRPLRWWWPRQPNLGPPGSRIAPPPVSLGRPRPWRRMALGPTTSGRPWTLPGSWESLGGGTSAAGRQWIAANPDVAGEELFVLDHILGPDTLVSALWAVVRATRLAWWLGMISTSRLTRRFSAKSRFGTVAWASSCWVPGGVYRFRSLTYQKASL